MIPECWTSVELITNRLTSCKIRIDLKNAYSCTQSEFGRRETQGYKLYQH